MQGARIDQIAIIGLGRFGQLWTELLAKHAARGKYRVIAYNRTPKPELVFPSAVKVASSMAEAVEDAQLLFICTAISSLPQVCEALSVHVKPNTIVCDTCSVKERPQRWMTELLPKHCELLGTHPMFGPDSLLAADTLPIVYTPIRISDTSLARCSALFELWELTGIKMSACQHDKLAAYSQGFTHLVGRIAERMDLPQTEIATLGYQKILHLMEQTCKDDWKLFVDIQRYNRYTKRMFSRFSRVLRSVRREVGRR